MQPQRQQQAPQPVYSVSVPSAPTHTLERSGTGAYPSLVDFMGLELTEEMIRLNMPEYARQPAHYADASSAVVAPQPNPS